MCTAWVFVATTNGGFRPSLCQWRTSSHGTFVFTSARGWVRRRVFCESTHTHTHTYRCGNSSIHHNIPLCTSNPNRCVNWTANMSPLPARCMSRNVFSKVAVMRVMHQSIQYGPRFIFCSHTRTHTQVNVIAHGLVCTGVVLPARVEGLCGRRRDKRIDK